MRVPISTLLLSLSTILITAGCRTGTTKDSNGGVDSSSHDSGSAYTDADQDGFALESGDCDDNNPDVHPGQEETCNGIDDNCNGVVDEGFSDTDMDGIADCVDTETCDGIDNNGNGLIDEGFPDANGNGIADCLEDEIL